MSASRRRRSPRKAPAGHSHHVHHHCTHEEQREPDAGRDGWPTGADIAAEYDLGAAMKAALEELDSDQMLTVLRWMPERPRRVLLSSIGLRSVSSLKRGMATQMLARLRNATFPDDVDDLALFTSPVTYFFDGQLGPLVWRLLTAEHPMTALAGLAVDPAQALVVAGVAALWPAYTRVGMLVAVATDAADAVIALGLLGHVDEAAREAYAALAEKFPELPDAPTRSLPGISPRALLEEAELVEPGAPLDEETLVSTLEDLREQLMSRFGDDDDSDGDEDGASADDADDADDGTGEEDVDGRGAGEVAEGFGQATSAVLEDPDEESVEQLLADTEDALATWPEQARAAAAAAEALAQGRCPQAGPLEELAAFARAVEVLAAAGGHDGSQRELRDSAEALRALLGSSQAPWLHRLAALAGPPGTEELLARLRTSVQAELDHPHPESAALAALREMYRLVELTDRGREAGPASFLEVAAAEAAAREALPELTPLIVAAVAGALTWPDPAAVAGPAAQEPPSPAMPEPAPAGAARPEPAPQAQPGAPESAAAPEAGTGPAAEAAPEPEAEPEPAGPETEDAPPGPAEPADAPVPGAGEDGGTVAHADADDATDGIVDVDLSDLDDLLSSGPGAALAALAAPRDARPPAAAKPAAEPAAIRTPAPSPTPAASAAAAAVGAAVEEAPRPEEADLTWGSPTITELHADLLAEGRYALGADLAAAAGAPTASVSARRMVAYADALRHPTGALASAFAAECPQITRENLAEDRCGQLLAWAAAARVALLAPGAGPAGVLLELAPCVADTPALAEVGQALAVASRTGLVILPEAADAVGTLASAEHELEDAYAETLALAQNARTRAIKYVPANAVYQSWMNSDGPLGQLLAMVNGPGQGDLSAVREATLALRGKAEKAIDGTHAERRSSKAAKIGSGARGTLVNRWNEVLDAVDRWCFAVQRHEERVAASRAETWQAGPLTAVRSRLAAVHERALAEVGAAAGDGAEAEATTEAVSALLEATFAVCDGRGPVGEEPDPAFVAHHELLAAGVDLPAGSLTPTQPALAAALPALLALAARQAPTAQQTYDRLAADRHHDLTALLIAGVRARAPREAAALERARAADVTAAAADAAEEVAALRQLLDTRRLSGAVSDTTWSSLSARVEALDAPARRDYGRIAAEAARIRAELDRHQQQRVEATLERVRERSAELPAVAEAADTVARLARAGHIASAEEYLEQTVAGGTLPTFEADTDHLGLFFPRLCDHAAAHPQLLGELREALGGGQAGAAVAGLAAIGVDPAALTQRRREDGRKAIGAWQALARAGSGRQVEAPSAVRAILAQAGLEFASLAVEKNNPAGRQWMTLRGVSGTGRALTPALGSAMSPDGATLRVLVVRSAPTPATVVEWMRTEPADHTVLVLWMGAALSADERRALANATRGRARPTVAVLDEAALAYLVGQAEPRTATLGALTLPFTATSPYRDTPGDIAPEMFYGRTEELAAVLDLDGPSFVSGGRQLGKSALLKVAQRRFTQVGPAREAVLTSIFTVGGDGDADRLWLVLWPRLAELGIVTGPVPADGVAAAVHAGIVEWIRADDARALLVLLDEADTFLDADAADNRFTNVDWCRRIMQETDRRAKVVFAGLHRTARFDSLPNQPLTHFGRPISVGPLRPQHAYDLVTRPLAALGFRFADPVATPARILALTNSMPALLQLFGAALVEHLTATPLPEGAPAQLVTDEDIDTVFARPDLKEAFREKYVATLHLDPRYQVIAYTVAQAAHSAGVDAGLSLHELSAQARLTWPAGFAECGSDDFRGLVTECVDLGLLALDEGLYRMRTPTVLRLLGTEEEVLSTLVEAAERLSVPSASDAGSYRRRVGSTRSPLTERQLGTLFAGAGQAVVVTGSVALGVDRVLAAVEEARDAGVARVERLIRCGSVTPEGLRAAVTRAGRSGLVLVDARTMAAPALAQLLSVGAALTASHPGVGVALVSGPDGAPAWVGWPHRVDLDRWDGPGLRLACDEENLPFRDEESRAQLRAGTGGWPLLVARAGQVAAAQGPVTTAEAVLEAVRDWLAGPGAVQLLGACAVGADQPVLAATLARVGALTATVGEDRDTLAQLLELDDPGLPAAVAQAGFADVAAVLETLAALGAVEVDEAGRWRAEPVLAAALARSAAVPA